ncbi:MAG: hypothetical protein LBM70_08025 [Victivallales bacterium]|jgi:hypothetical protein|nr:hypothetical protein [Victivallales bacterium]
MGLRFYYFNSTHWDREWYQTFQVYRRYLVTTADGILKALENDPNFSKYTFDGQSVVLEDIVEIRPEWRERLEKQIASGRLNVGPWYVMPDEFLISGEATIRNLLIGDEVVRGYGGKPWQTAYICDIFGHCAQTPQIFKGFGLEPAVLWRGTDSTFPPYFMWEAPDGTKCETVKYHSYSGYAAFSLKVSGWWDKPHKEEQFKERLQKYVDWIRPYYGDAVVLTDALDHIEVHSQAPEYLKWIKEVYPDAEVIHTDFREIKREFSNDAPVISGELIATADLPWNNTWMIPHTLSSRYDVKSTNDKCQNLLEGIVDMLLADRVAVGASEMTPFWKFAWKQLVKNQTHDSICGCSIDAVHRQVLTRLEEVQEIGETIIDDLVLADRERLTGKSIEFFTHVGEYESRAGLEADNDGNYTFRIYNPLPYEREGVVDIDIAFPTSVKYPYIWSEPFGYESINGFRIYDLDGREIPYQLGTIRRNQLKRFYRHDSRVFDLYSVAATVKLSASGWTTLHLKPSDTPVRYFDGQLTGRKSAANGRIELSVNADGSFNIVDLKTKRTYAGINAMILDREIGDGWNHVKPQGASTLVSGTATSISVRSDGPARTVFEIVTCYELPREIEFRGTLGQAYGGIFESEDTAVLSLTSTVTLDKDGDMVKVKTVIDNNIKDYRLRLVIPTGVTGKYFAYQNFAFIEREPGRATGKDSRNYMESEPLEKNFSGIVGKRDAKAGLAFIARYGLHEVSAAPTGDGELYVTLLRAFRRTVATNGEVEGQLQRQLTYEYAFKLMDENVRYSDLWRTAQEYRAKLPSHMVPGLGGKKNVGWIRIFGDLALAALKPAQSAMDKTVILRFINLSDKPGKAVVELTRPARITPVDLSERPIGKTGDAITRFEVEDDPWHLATYKLEF